MVIVRRGLVINTRASRSDVRELDSQLEHVNVRCLKIPDTEEPSVDKYECEILLYKNKSSRVRVQFANRALRYNTTFYTLYTFGIVAENLTSALSRFLVYLVLCYKNL